MLAPIQFKIKEIDLINLILHQPNSAKLIFFKRQTMFIFIYTYLQKYSYLLTGC